MTHKLTIRLTTQQVELEYDASNQVDLTVSSGGNLTVAASGGDISFSDENLVTTGTLGAGATSLTALLKVTATTQQLELEYDASNQADFTVGSSGNLTIETTGAIIINEDGSDDDFRIEGDGDANLFYLDAGNDRVGIRIAAPTAIVHIDQSATDGAEPALLLDQADIDEDYLKIIGTSDTNVDRALVDAADFTTPGAIAGWLKINVQDDQATNPITDGDYYIPFYAAPSA